MLRAKEGMYYNPPDFYFKRWKMKKKLHCTTVESLHHSAWCHKKNAMHNWIIANLDGQGNVVSDCSTEVKKMYTIERHIRKQIWWRSIFHSVWMGVPRKCQQQNTLHFRHIHKKGTSKNYIYSYNKQYQCRIWFAIALDALNQYTIYSVRYRRATLALRACV